MKSIKIPKFGLIFRRFIYVVLIAFPVLLLGLWGYTEFASYPPDQDILYSAYNNRNVKIEAKVSYFEIIPNVIKPDASAIIFYPGGLVKPESYLAKMVKLAQEAQTKVFLIKPLFNLAFFNIASANQIISDYSLYKPIVAGHSLGGVAACRFLKDNPDKVSGIYLYGSYCDQSITDFKGAVLSVIGQNDQVLERESYEKAKPNLPSQTNFREIPDLNHSSFGDYGLQKGDGSSGQSLEDVVKLMVL